MLTSRIHGAPSAGPVPAVAGSFVQGLARQDFAEIGGTLAGGACMRALLPSGLREWTGAEAIAHRFARWFGDTEDFELVEAAVGEVGGRLHLHWRLRLRAERLGVGWFIVEQQAYADTGEGGRITRLDLNFHGPVRGGAHLGSQIGEGERYALRRGLVGDAAHEVALRVSRLVRRQRKPIGGIADQAETPRKYLDVHRAVIALHEQSIEELPKRLESRSPERILPIGNDLDDRLGGRGGFAYRARRGA